MFSNTDSVSDLVVKLTQVLQKHTSSSPIKEDEIKEFVRSGEIQKTINEISLQAKEDEKKELVRSGEVQKTVDKVFLIGVKKAYENNPDDKYKPSITELLKFGREEVKKEKSPIKDFKIFYKRIEIANKCIIDNFHKFECRQYDKIINSMISSTEKFYTKLLFVWRYNAIKSEKIYQELMKSEDDKSFQPVIKKKHDKDPDEDLCIICLDDLRSTIYKPCGHRVCCNNCADILWQFDKTCPWCRKICFEP